MRYQITRQLRINNGLGFEGCAEEEVLLETSDKEKAEVTMRQFENYYDEMMIPESECEFHKEYIWHFLEIIDDDDNIIDEEWFIIG